MPVRHVELMRSSTSACCEPVNLPVAAGTGVPGVGGEPAGLSAEPPCQVKRAIVTSH